MPCSCYILTCSDGSYYVGSTRNLDVRLNQHRNGHVQTTSKRLPVHLTYQEDFGNYRDAYLRERQLKGWKSRHALERLMNSYSAPSSNG